MALVTIIDSEGRSVVVHTSIFDRAPRIPWKSPEEREAEWAAVWARYDRGEPDWVVESWNGSRGALDIIADLPGAYYWTVESHKDHVMVFAWRQR